MIQVILFDFYGVFIADAYNNWLVRNRLTREGVFERLIRERDSGQLNETDFLQLLSETTGHQITLEDIHHPSDAQLDRKLVDLAQHLKPHYRIGLLSNASTDLRSKLTNLDIIALFDEIVISGEIGHAKPSVEAFTITLERLSVTDPRSVLFIDDNPVNVEAAARNGMTAIQFTSVDKLIHDLRIAGVRYS